MAAAAAAAAMEYYQADVTIPDVSEQETETSSATAFYSVQLKLAPASNGVKIECREWRYSQFRVLHLALCRKFGKRRLPAFPSRSSSVSKRRQILESYMKHLVQDEEICSSQPFCAFFRSTTLAKGISRPRFLRDRIVARGRNPLSYLPFTLNAVVGTTEVHVKQLLHFPAEAETTASAVVLDVGAADGLASIIAARQSPKVSIIAAEKWTPATRARFESNVLAEFISGQSFCYETLDCDPTDLSEIPDGSVDIIISCFRLHKLESVGARQLALDEMARVLKPKGGQMLIMDAYFVRQYAKHLASCGMEGEVSKRLHFSTVPVRYVLVTPAGSKRPLSGSFVDDIRKIQEDGDLMDDTNDSGADSEAGGNASRSSGKDELLYSDIWWQDDEGEWFVKGAGRRAKRRWYKLDKGKGRLCWSVSPAVERSLGAIKLSDIKSVAYDKSWVTIITAQTTHKLGAKDEETANVWTEMLRNAQGQGEAALGFLSDSESDADSLGESEITSEVASPDEIGEIDANVSENDTDEAEGMQRGGGYDLAADFDAVPSAVDIGLP